MQNLGQLTTSELRQLIISRWAGHYDSAFTYKQYVHASDDDLAAGRDALARIYKIG